jgi:peptidoglycan hydrolase CwlO-like protein
MDPEINKSFEAVIARIDTKVRSLSADYTKLKAENEKLRLEIENLQQQIVHQKNKMHLESENNILINIAQSMSENGQSKEELLLSVDRLLKQLDEYIWKLKD